MINGMTKTYHSLLLRAFHQSTFSAMSYTDIGRHIYK